jgi:glycerate kinase
LQTSPDKRLILVAPDKFKGSASAAEVASALARGIATVPGVGAVTCPIADGGDGTVEVLLAAGYRGLALPGADALRRPTTTTVAVGGPHVVIELADVCGLARFDHLEPVRSGTTGLGTTLRAVLDLGYRDVTIGLGGSASTDGGIGLLVGLGASVTDVDGQPVTPDGAGLLRARHLDLGGVRLPFGTRLRLACDVDAPLHGPRGAAVMFGPQKGLTPADIEAFDEALVGWGRLLTTASGREIASVPGAGAAGGVGAAGLAVGATVIGGADFVFEAIDFHRHLGRASVVVTGEGSWDEQSTRGKGPGRVVAEARRSGLPVALVTGRLTATADGVARAWSLTQIAGSSVRAQSEARNLLEQLGVVVARWAASLAIRA